MNRHVYLLATMILVGCACLGFAQDTKVGRLVTQLKNPDAGIRARAAFALKELGPTAKTALPALATALSDTNLNVRYWAATTLKQFGPEAVSAVPALVMSLKTFPGGTPKLEGPHRYFADIRSVSAEALGAIGPGSKDAIPALKEATKDKNADVQAAAVMALKNIQAK